MQIRTYYLLCIMHDKLLWSFTKLIPKTKANINNCLHLNCYNYKISFIYFNSLHTVGNLLEPEMNVTSSKQPGNSHFCQHPPCANDPFCSTHCFPPSLRSPKTISNFHFLLLHYCKRLTARTELPPKPAWTLLSPHRTRLRNGPYL